MTKVLNETDNKLLNRKEIEYEVEYSGATPTKEKIKDELAKDLKLNPELVVVKHIYPYYGKRKSKVIVYIYDNVDNLKRIEIKNKKAKIEKVEEKTKE